jgi:hypothetical protein
MADSDAEKIFGLDISQSSYCRKTMSSIINNFEETPSSMDPQERSRQA